MFKTVALTAILAAGICVGAAAGRVSSRCAAPVEPAHRSARSLCGELAARAREALTADTSSRQGTWLRVIVLEPELRVCSSPTNHPAAFRAGPLDTPRPVFTDATYKARLTVELELLDRSGRVLARSSFTGRAAKVVRNPPPHPFRTFASIHAIGGKHVGCSYYPEREHLLGLALHDALDGSRGAAAWLRCRAGR